MNKEDVLAKVLIVEDEPEFRETLRLGLNDMPLKVYEAQNGADARFKLKNEVFDIMVLDLNMPKLSGDKLINEFIKFSPEQLPKNIIVCSGNISREHLDVFKEVSKKSKVKLFSKPLKMDDFQNYIITCLG
jgi:DNA-binding response OmpR family regulator